MFERKMGFPGMITSVQSIIDQNDAKTTKRTINHKREESVQAVWSQQYSALSPKSADPCRVRLSPWAFALSGDPLDKHSYTV